ncbi:hypothetical protein TIFTF001_051211 [Ficus carica]|uniref:Uncharacterized protein n=1 Tax=Ficus carica TaxID=3494 RepID=A0AA87YTB6_FICCA|nr:hypothetical protein TIFTF001_051211 [Ficus carica]
MASRSDGGTLETELAGMGPAHWRRSFNLVGAFKGMIMSSGSSSSSASAFVREDLGSLVAGLFCSLFRQEIRNF